VNIKSKEAAAYFHETRGFERIMSGFIKRYRSLGRIGGSIRLETLTSNEKRVLEQVFRRSFSQKQSARINLLEFEESLCKTKFEGSVLMEILQAYHGSPILTHEEVKSIRLSARALFFSEIQKLCESPLAKKFMQAVLDKEKGTLRIHQLFEKDFHTLQKLLENVIKALNILPTQEFILMPFFASSVTGDPHAFDLDKEQGKLLLKAMYIVSDREVEPYTAEEKNELFEEFGITKDDIANYISVIGIDAFDSNGNQLLLSNVALNFPLKEVVKVSSVSSRFRKVAFVVENSGVFSRLCDSFAEKPVILCTQGQVKLAGLLFMNKLVENGYRLYYSGDFDPEGLQMAQRLKYRYKNNLIIWRYAYEDYNESKPSKPVEESRIAKLNSIEEEALIAIKESILNHRLAGYQEQIIHLYELDITKIIKLFKVNEAGHIFMI